MERYLILIAQINLAGFALLVFKPAAFRKLLRALWALSVSIEHGGRTFTVCLKAGKIPAQPKDALPEPRGARDEHGGYPPSEVSSSAEGLGRPPDPLLSDRCAALVAQGVKEKQARQMVAYAASQLPGSQDFAELFRVAAQQKSN